MYFHSSFFDNLVTKFKGRRAELYIFDCYGNQYATFFLRIDCFSKQSTTCILFFPVGEEIGGFPKVSHKFPKKILAKNFACKKSKLLGCYVFFRPQEPSTSGEKQGGIWLLVEIVQNIFSFAETRGYVE